MQTCSKCGTPAAHPAPFCSVCGASLFAGGVMPPIPALPMAPKTSGFAIAGFVLSFVCGVLGLIFSLLGYSEAKKSKGRITGEGFAIAGIVISLLSILSAIFLWWMFTRTVTEIGKLVDESGPRMNLRRMTMRAESYQIEHGAFPQVSVPATSSCCSETNQRCRQDWDLPEWKALQFEVDAWGGGETFRYGFRSTPTSFEAIAVGDTDCDGDEVTFTLRVNPDTGRETTIQRSGED